MVDQPHVLKSIRAMLMSHKIYLPEETVEEHCLPSNVVDMEHVRAVVRYQEDQVMKLAPRLKEEDTDPKHFSKMDVGSALHVFSHDTASAIRWLVNKRDYPIAYLSTAWFIDQVAEWFRLMSSRYGHAFLLTFDRLFCGVLVPW